MSPPKRTLVVCLRTTRFIICYGFTFFANFNFRKSKLISSTQNLNIYHCSLIAESHYQHHHQTLCILSIWVGNVRIVWNFLLNCLDARASFAIDGKPYLIFSFIVYPTSNKIGSNRSNSKIISNTLTLIKCIFHLLITFENYIFLHCNER